MGCLALIIVLAILAVLAGYTDVAGMASIMFWGILALITSPIWATALAAVIAGICMAVVGLLLWIERVVKRRRYRKSWARVRRNLPPHF